ncbi:F-box domain-containing protein [Mycena kentingensis (nom. inval.)]|nr:F-box domain-containing protein [Mycena kentingensis (nom. inval.)]
MTQCTCPRLPLTTMALPIPLELTSAIFRFLPTGTISTRDLPASSLQPPLLFGKVCREWRAISRGTPHLWRSLSLELYAELRPFEHEKLTALVTEWLRRSGQLPLHFTLSRNHLQRLDAPENIIVSLLMHFAPRIEHLYLSLPHIDLVGICYNDTATLPALRAVSVVETDSLPGGTVAPFSYLRGSPLLQDMTIRGGVLPDLAGPGESYVPWLQLTRFAAYDRVSVSDGMQILSLATSLEEFTLSCIFTRNGDDSDLEDTRTILPHARLRRLNIYGTNPDNALTMLQILRLPQLEALALRLNKTDEYIFEFTSFIERSDCASTLRELKLGAELENDDLSVLFRALHNLEDLHYTSGDFADVLAALTAGAGNPLSLALPALRKVQLTTTTFLVPTGMFASFADLLDVRGGLGELLVTFMSPISAVMPEEVAASLMAHQAKGTVVRIVSLAGYRKVGRVLFGRA